MRGKQTDRTGQSRDVIWPGAEFAQSIDATLMRLTRTKRADIEGWTAQRVEQQRRFPFVLVEKARDGRVLI